MRNEWCRKVAETTWAHPHQGLRENVQRYRNSPVMHESMPEAFKPLLLVNGREVPFPPPTRPIKPPKARPAAVRLAGSPLSEDDPSPRWAGVSLVQ